MAEANDVSRIQMSSAYKRCIQVDILLYKVDCLEVRHLLTDPNPETYRSRNEIDYPINVARSD